MARDTVRSAVTASQVGMSANVFKPSSKSARSAHTSMPSAPCPAAGSISVVAKLARMRSGISRRFKPAAANTIASYWPSSSLRKRVSRLPRSGSIFRSGRKALSSTKRRKLDVPITAPCGSSDRLAYLFDTKASCGSSRCITQASAKPSGKSIGTSLSECTAMSARPSCKATSSSLTNKPLPPTLLSDRSKIWSPNVVMPNSSTCQPNRVSSSAFMYSACHMAKRLSRVAITTFLTTFLTALSSLNSMSVAL